MPTNMAIEGANQTARFKTGLLFGASVLAMVALSQSAAAQNVPAADRPKWSPQASVTAQAGDTTGVKFTGFDPVWQDLNSMLYVRLGFGTQTRNGLNGSLGIGFRTRVFEDWIAGLYAGVDGSTTKFGKGYTQASFGGELMNADWDFRANGYLPMNRGLSDLGAYRLIIQDTTIAILQKQLSAYSGFDGQVGYRVFNTDNLDVRVFAGGFSFEGASTRVTVGGKTLDFGPGKIQGPTGGVEADLYNFDVFGKGARVTITGQVSNDDVRGTTGYAGISLQVPIGGSDDDNTSTDEFDRRMVDPLRRQDFVLAEAGYSKPEPVIISNSHITSVALNTINYADNATGSGSYVDPTNLHDATATAPFNKFIVLIDRQGVVNANNVTLQSGETVTGPGVFTVKGTVSGATFTHNFAPGSGHVTVKANPGITLASTTNLYGFTFNGPFVNGIYGHNVTGVVISGVTINGPGTNGIYIHEDNGTSANIDINNTTIGGGITQDGVKLVVANTTGSTATVTATLTGMNITAGVNGVDATTTVNGNSHETVNVGVHNSNVSGGTNDVIMTGTVFAGSTLTQNLVVDPTHLTGGLNGFVALANANGGTLIQNVNLSQVYVTGVTDHGVEISASAINNGTVTQNVTMSQVSVTGGQYPVLLSNYATGGGNASQFVTMNHVTATGGHYNDIALVEDARYGGTAHQTLTANNITATNSVAYSGVYLYVDAYDSSTAIQTVTLNHLTATGNYGDGVTLDSSADNHFAGHSAVAAQYVSIANSTLSGNNYDGVDALVSGFDDSVARQDLTVSHSTLGSNTGYGLDVVAVAGFHGAAQQNINLYYDNVSDNGSGGAAIYAVALGLGSVQQNATIYGSAFDGNLGDGIFIGAHAFYAGQILQNTGIYYSEAIGNTGDGLRLTTDAYGYAIGSSSAYYSHIGQNVIAYSDIFSFNARNGVEIQNYAGYGAQVDQFVYLANSHMDLNGPTVGPVPFGAGNGVYENSLAEAYGSGGGAITTNLYADLYVVSSSADQNRLDGLRVKGTADGPTYLIQHLDVLGTHADYNGRSGFVAYDNASNFYSFNAQYVTLSGATLDGNGLDGAAFLATQHYGPLSFGAAIQNVTISNTDLSYNTRDGLYAYAQAYQFQGRAEQHFTISGSYLDGNGGDGAHFYNNAHDGVYVAGLDCGTVQGLTGGCSFVRTTVTAIGTDFSFNGGDGIYIGSHADTYGAVYARSGRPAYVPTLLMEYSTANSNGGDGLHIENHASNYSYIYSYAFLLGSSVDNNTNHGIEVNSTADTGSLVVQKTVLYGVPGYQTFVSANGGDGLSITSAATGATIQQLVGIYNSRVSFNTGGDGVYVSATASGGSASYPSVVAQYFHVGNSRIDNNTGNGVTLHSTATGPFAVTSQTSSATYTSFDTNGGDGFHADARSYAGGAANQDLYFAADDFASNHGDGVHVFGLAAGQGFTKQTVNFGYHTGFNTYAEGNGGDGVYIGTSAFTGANTYQGALVYDVVATSNGGDGLAVASTANGYGFGPSTIYYSHVSQNLIAAYDTFDSNVGNGASINNTTYYGGVLNQFAQLYSVDVSRNLHAGFYDKSTQISVRGNSFAFSTNTSSSVYLINSTFDYNATNGIELNSYADGAVYHPAFFGGYSYLIQHIHVSGSSAEYNTAAGLSLRGNQNGRYSLNAEYVTISGARFDHNTGDGARFGSISYYGPGGFGDTFEQFTISNTDFSHNGGDGINFGAFSSGNQGRAEQHATITGSTFDYNGGDGVHIYASATNGVLVAGHPCTAIQGLAGGCAFVRQNVNISNSDMSNNTGNGVSVGTYADSHGAIYGASGRPHAPTLYLAGDTVDHNGSRGLQVSNHVSNGSYLYQYNANIDSTFDHNASDGIYASSYVGGASTMRQRTLLYSYHTTASASYNAGNGFKSAIEALGGSYARDVNIAQGVDLSHDGSFGFDGAIAYADATSNGRQINAVYFNTVDHNGDGVGVYSIGAGAFQKSYFGGNEIRYNSFVGAYGEANFGAYQYVGIYTFGNTVNTNGTDYLFNAFGGATQVLN